MSQLNDVKFEKLRTLLFTGSINDMELAWLQGEGALSDDLNDAWDEVLTLNQINDGKLAYYLANGATTNQINEAALEFWEALV